MSTTTWQAPWRSVSSSTRRRVGVGAGEQRLHQDRLAEDRRRLGQRHRRLALQRRAVGQLGVVVGVAELVGEGLHAVDGAAEVEQHPALVAPHRHAEGAAALAVARADVDPALVDGPLGQAAQRRGRRAEGVGDRRRWPRPTWSPTPPGRRRARTGPTTAGAPSAWPSSRALAVEVAARSRGATRRTAALHRLEHLALDVVGEQRRLEVVGPAPPAVERRRLALHAVEARRPAARRRSPTPPARRRRPAGGTPASASKARLRTAVIGSASPSTVGGEPGRDLAVELVPRRAAREVELGGEVLLGLATAGGRRRRRPGARRGRGRRPPGWRRGAASTSKLASQASSRVRSGASGAVCGPQLATASAGAGSSRASVVTKAWT